MAWCPKCKNEYREGIAVCPDCEIDLVEELPEEIENGTPVPVILCHVPDEQTGMKFAMYLQYNGLQTAATVAADELDSEYEDGFCVIVANFEEEAANKVFEGFDSVEELSRTDLSEIMPELERQLEELQDEEANMMLSELRSESSSVYVKKRDKYTDLKFSGISFIIFSVLGLGLVLANYMGYIHLFNTFSSLTMGAVFAIFLVIGIVSLSKASQMVGMVSQEEKANDDILVWIEENITDEWISTLIQEGETEENNYFAAHKAMCDRVAKQYPLIHHDYIDELMDERYNEFYEK